MKKIAFSLFLLLFLLSSVSLAVPTKINYQGFLKDSSGNPMTGKYQMTFAIYDGPGSGATELWSETQSVSVEAGLYSVLLGVVNSIDPATFEGSTRYLGVKVGTDLEMEPRIPLITVPYAFRAAHADSAGTAIGGNADTFGGRSVNEFVWLGPPGAQETNKPVGLQVRSLATSGIGVWGESIDNIGVHGTSSSGAAVVGASGTGDGVLGLSGSGIGIHGSSESGTGVKGHGATAGVYGWSNSVSGYGVTAVNSAPADALHEGAALYIDGKIKSERGDGKAVGTKGTSTDVFGAPAIWQAPMLTALSGCEIKNQIVNTNSIVLVFPKGEPDGRWWAEPFAGYFHVYSTVNEISNNPDFSYLIIN